MSNYGTAYNISQTGNLYTLEAAGAKAGLAQYNSTRGTTVNSPINYRFLKLFHGFDNEFFFFIKNQDRKPIMLQGMVVNASIINRSTKSSVINKQCTITDYELGSIKLVVTSSESATMEAGLFDIVFSYTNSLGLTMPMFCDLNMRPNYTLEVTDTGGAIPLATQATTTFIENSGMFTSSVLPGPGYYAKANSMITIAVYASNYTGNFYIQGTLTDAPVESDWFNIILGSYTDDYYPYINFDGIDPWTFRSNIKLIRGKFTQTSGTLDKLVVRV